MATKIRKVIWSSIDIDMDAFEEMWSNNGYDEEYPDYTEDDKFRWAWRDNNSIYRDIVTEQFCLCKCRHTEGILVIATLGTWKRHHSGYMEIGSFNECFTFPNDDYMEFYIEDGEFKAKGIHHDVTNYYVFRERRENISDDDWQELLYSTYSGRDASALIEKCTVSLMPMANNVWLAHGFYMDGHRFVYEEISGYSHNFVYSDDGTVIPFSSDMIA